MVHCYFNDISFFYPQITPSELDEHYAHNDRENLSTVFRTILFNSIFSRDSRLYKRVCPRVRPSARPSVRGSRVFFDRPKIGGNEER